MQLRTFLAGDMKAALAEVRAEMGPDAVIIASERAKGGGVIVRAALDKMEAPEQQEPSEGPTDFETTYRDALVRRLRDGKPAAHPTRRRFDRAELLGALARHRLPDTLAHMLAEESAKTGLSDMTLALAAAIDARLTPAPIQFASAAALLVVGPNGAGKTAVAAKLAAHAKLAGRAVMLIAGDVAGAGAVARLKEFADHLDAGIATADSAVAIAPMIAQAATHGTLAVIDTAGFDPRQPKAAAAFSALMQLDGVEALGVASALCDSEEISEIAAALAQSGATRLVITGADLARRAGALAAAALTPGQRLAYITRSPFVAGGLEALTSLGLARLLVEAGSAQ
ncbi:MAG: hypothetical protein KGJ78_04920 [Alphaproteobacteria bacterium]|nr:hypothetical protein [Alphaproteobacteria bacterium]